MKKLENVFSAQERLIFSLRELYEGYGYIRFPVRRFEEYALYQDNKSFLKEEGVLAFTDANGKLMALKPDVTLSIVKRARADKGSSEKLYYTESVYRVAKTEREYVQIEQMGVEYLGNVDLCGVCEVVRLAVESLRATGQNHLLEMSHMGFVDGLLEAAGIAAEDKDGLFALIRQKNAHELRMVLQRMAVHPADIKRIEALTVLCGPLEETLNRAEELAVGQGMHQAVEELRSIQAALMSSGIGDHLRLDMSIVNDLAYYNGLVFRGYVQGIPRAVLSGGRYDHLMRRFGKEGNGIGFALYLDEITRLVTDIPRDDVDILALYQAEDDAGEVLAAADVLRQGGKRVMTAQQKTPELQVGRVVRFAKGRFEEVEA